MAAFFILFEAFVITGRDAVAREDRPQVAQHEIGAYDARFPEVGTSGRGLAVVVVVDVPAAHDRNAGKFRVLGRQFRQRVSGTDVEPEIGGVGQQVGLLHVDGHRRVRIVLRVDVLPAGILDQADHVALR